jgi:hypothetical protein
MRMKYPYESHLELMDALPWLGILYAQWDHSSMSPGTSACPPRGQMRPQRPQPPPPEARCAPSVLSPPFWGQMRPQRPLIPPNSGRYERVSPPEARCAPSVLSSPPQVVGTSACPPPRGWMRPQRPQPPASSLHHLILWYKNQDRTTKSSVALQFSQFLIYNYFW